VSRPELIALSPAEVERLERTDQLAELGDGGVAPLCAMLTDVSWVVRRAVVSALAALGEPAVAPLCQILRGPRDHEGQLAACVDALVASAAPVEDAMIALTGDDRPAAVSDAVQVLGRRRAAAATPVLMRLSRHADDNVAVAAIEALGHVGGRAAVESLIEIVDGGNFFRTFPAIDVLGRSGDPRVIEPLSRLLDHPHFAPEAARALGRTGDPEAVAPLVGMAERGGEALVRIAALSLADLAERHHERYGRSTAVEDAIRAAAALDGLVRRLDQSIAAADADEQIAVARVLAAVDSDEAVPVLSRLLDLPEPVASAAADGLHRIGERADAQVIATLRRGDSQRRLALLPQISRRGATDAVLSCLDDGDAAVRAAACDALARIGHAPVVPRLFALLADPSPRAAQAAVGAIQSLGSTETEVLGLDAARSPQPEVRRAAFRILSYFGYASALSIFSDAIDDPDPRVRDAAIQGLPYIEAPQALEKLLGAARRANERVRAVAFRALGHSRGDARVVSVLLRGLADADPWARYYAAQSLGRLGVEQAASALARLLDDAAGQVRVATIEALSHLRSELAFQSLRDAAQAADADVRRAALIGLGISRRAEAEPILLDSTASIDPATRLVAVSAVADYESTAVLHALERAAADRDESVRTAAIGFLSGRSGPDATQALVRILPLFPERERVVAALSVWVEGRVDALVDALARAGEEITAHLVAALVRMRRPDAWQALVGAMALPSAAARKAVAAALPAVTTREAHAALSRAAAEDADEEVRRIASLVLTRQ
jgi:HEAT repeat protein